MHTANKKRVLEQLFQHATISRADIARNLGLNKSTVSSLYTELATMGLVEMIGSGESTNNGGRRPDLIRLKREYGYVISFEIGTYHTRAMANYLNGEVLDFAEFDTPQLDALAMLQLIKNVITQMQQVAVTDQGLIGLGFAIHGIVDDNRVVDSPFINFHGIDLQTFFQDEYQVPVVVENEANAAAVFERDFNLCQQANNILAISIHRGIGSGIITSNRLYHGNHGMAGEIGRSLVTTNQGLVKVETICSEEAFLSLILRDVDQNWPLAWDDLKAIYQQQSVAIGPRLAETVEQLGKTVFNAITSFGPDVVFFSSPLFDAVPEIFVAVKEWLLNHGTTVTIKRVQGSQQVSLLGTSALAIRAALDLQGYQLSLVALATISHLD
ncbi:MAG: ROK family transcriptional regulator [Limosilactobacillus sp.]|nr:ROK family transcriptional regulator [Limosilactobacillus sp.]